jgi:flagellar biosynthesis protein FlhF
MYLQKFEAADMTTALEKVRAMMGEEAMIVKSRTVRKGGLFGLAKRDRVEVCAALSQPAAEKRNGNSNGKSGGEDRWEPSQAVATGHLQERLSRLDSKLDTLLIGLGVGTLHRTSEKDTGNGNGRISPQEVHHDEEALRRLAQQMPICGEISLEDKPARIALVGPTGVGKTTTLLKLAGDFSLCRGKKVTILTADTFRLGAVEQLKAFSRVFKVGLRVALSPEEMIEALTELGGEDLILIDTPGGSQRDHLHQSQVEGFLQAAEPSAIHLVLSATSRASVIKECIKTFSALNADRLIFTKLDEAARLHEAFAAALGSGLPISYLGCGQEIPDDLEAATEERLAELMIGTDSEEAG